MEFLLHILETTRKEEIYTVNLFMKRRCSDSLFVTLVFKNIAEEVLHCVLEHSHKPHVCIKYYFNFFARLNKQNTTFYKYCNSQISLLGCFLYLSKRGTHEGV